MRIGIDVNSLSDIKRTGIGKYTEGLLFELFKQKQPFHYFLYSALPLEKKIKEKLAFCIHVTYREGFFPSRYLWQQFVQGFQIRHDQLDVYLSMDGLLPLFSPPNKSASIVHDMMWHHYPNTVPVHVRLAYQYRFSASVRKARFCIANSMATQKDVNHYTRKNINHIPVIYPGRDPHFKRLDAKDARKIGEKLKLPVSYFLYVGNLKPHKNILKLIQAYALAKQKYQEDKFPKLVLAGHGDKNYLLEVKKEINKQHLNGSVFLTGYITFNDLIAIYNGAFAFLFPSLCEGFGFPIIEAQACGIPVISSNLYSLPEVGGDSVLYFNPLNAIDMADKMIKLFNDKSLSFTLVKKGFENIKRFSWTRTVEQVCHVLRSIN